MIFFKLCAISLTVALFSAAVSAQKLKADEIIAKHLDSIGTNKQREQVKNQMAAGTSRFESKLPDRKAVGKAIIVSEGSNLFFAASFNSREYSFEKIGFFKNKVSLPFATAGSRSPLGAFIADHPKILDDGLFAGSISKTWLLLNSAEQKGKFQTAGTKTVGGRKAYALNYFSKSLASSEMTIKLFFDAENFQHLKTEYRHTISGKQQPFGTLGTQPGVEISITETFGDFKNTNGLTLPHSYKIQYLTDSNSGTYEYDWVITITQYLFNQNLAPDFFTFEEK